MKTKFQEFTAGFSGFNSESVVFYLLYSFLIYLWCIILNKIYNKKITKTIYGPRSFTHALFPLKSALSHVPPSHLSTTAEPIIHIDFCLGKLCSTLENKQVEQENNTCIIERHWCFLQGRQLCCIHISQSQVLEAWLCLVKKWFSISSGFPNKYKKKTLFQIYHTAGNETRCLHLWLTKITFTFK